MKFHIFETDIDQTKIITPNTRTPSDDYKQTHSFLEVETRHIH